MNRLISPDYLREQERLHAAPRGYGQRGRKWADTVLGLAEQYGCTSVLDYGCGTGSLGEQLRARSRLLVHEYDPAIPGKNMVPRVPVDLVVCTDVLEHVEADLMMAVLAHLRRCTRRVLFVVISLVPTAKLLSTGEQAHISLHPVDWWQAALEMHDFRVAAELDVKPEKQWVAVLTC